MKILLVGSDHVWSIERIYYKWLVHWQQEVQLFPAQNEFYAYYQHSVLNKLIYRAGLSRIIPRINSHLREAVTRFRPDVVWVFKGMEVQPATVKWIREQGIFVANFNGDNPFIFSGAGSGNPRVTAGIPLYDLHLTYNLEVKDRLEREYHTGTAWLPFGFEVSEEQYERCRQQAEVLRVCFLGNPDDGRVSLIRELLDRGVGIDVYGHDWDKFIHHDNLNIHGPVYEEDFWLTLYRYRVQLNLMRPHNLRSHNMRTFEIPGIGGIQLAPDNPEHRLFFDNGSEAFLYADVTECAALAQKIMALPSGEAAQIRERARRRSLNSGYTYKDRTLQALEKIRTLHA